MVFGFLLIGIAVSLLFAYWITNPISRVTKAFESINLDDEFLPVRVKTHDEIDTLANKFNEMAFRLQKAHSELKRAQKSLVRAEKMASIGTLTAGLAHEISNPLAGLKNCLFRIKKRPSETVINRYFGLMVQAIQKIERVVFGLLDFSRQDAFQFKPFLLHKSIDRALSLAGYRIEMNRIDVIRKYDERLKLIQGDSQQIEQVVINLVLNAIDAMPLEGKLFISTALDDSTVNIEIEDTGDGIAAENIEKIFEPFYTTKEPGKGTGLGLSVSYHIVKEHGGDISVESQEKRGTKFVIKLPLTQGVRKI
jgi:two-component system NtrC family sensor kinase